MPTIDLSTPSRTRISLLDGLPRRVTLTLPELRLLAERAGGAPLPFEGAEGEGTGSALDVRLGQSRGVTEDRAYAAALAGLRDPEDSLERRGLLADDRSLVGAVGLLATPRVALDLDVSAVGIQARAWHRQAGEAVATLATVDGVVFELAWFAVSQWAVELGRVPALPEDCRLERTAVPPRLDAPFALVDAACEATRGGRADLLPVLAAQHLPDSDGALTDDDGALSADEAVAVLGALSTECRGRLRALVAAVDADTVSPIGVVSWTLLADGWHALRPRRSGSQHRLEVVAVVADDLAAELAPALAEVVA